MSIHPDLPQVCYAYLEEEGRVIGLLRGEPGYRAPSNLPDGLNDNPAAAKAWIERQNAMLGVTPPQREAMLAGSMFGWHLPIADPAKFVSAQPYSHRV